MSGRGGGLEGSGGALASERRSFGGEGASATRLVLVLLAALALSGCHRVAPMIERPGDAVIAPSADALASAAGGTPADPDTHAVLRLGPPPGGKRFNLPIPEFEVAVKRTIEGPKTVVELLSDGEILEREVYQTDEKALRAVEAGDLRFDPPLDLVRFPARDGAAWGWEGKVVYGGLSRAARAQVVLAHDDGDVRSDVALSVPSDGVPTDPKRSLVFWFRKGHGVVRRAFENASCRYPVGEKWRP